VRSRAIQLHVALFVFGLGCGLPSSAMPAPAVDRPFDPATDLLSLHYDHAPDRDDGHSAAADRTVLEARFGARWIRRHVIAVSGAYGWLGLTFKEGSNAVMEAAWGTRSDWLDAHGDSATAVEQLAARWVGTLSGGGDVWVKEGGTSDLTAQVVRRVQQARPDLDTRTRVHVVQHSGVNEWIGWFWNLRFVRGETDYRRIANANDYLKLRGGNRRFEQLATAHQSVGPVWSAAFKYYDPRRALDFSDTGALLHILGLGEPDIDSFASMYLVDAAGGEGAGP